MQNTYVLYHHGVKGQKWGVRRYQQYPKGKHGTFLGQSRDDDILIKRGTAAYRVQHGKKLIGEGQTYVAFDKLDHIKYLSISTDSETGLAVSGTMPGSKKQSVKLLLKNDLIAPSYQKSMDAFIDTVDKIGLKNVSKEISKFSKKDAKDFIKEYKHKTITECRDEAYVKFVSTFANDSKARKMFYGNLQKQGYNALIDEWDNDFGDGMTKSPVIVFDKQKDLKVSKTKEISSKDNSYFEDIYNENLKNYYLKKYDKKIIKKWDKFAESTDYRARYPYEKERR